MRSILKRLLLVIIDAGTLYLSYYVSYLVLNLLDMQTTDTIIQNAYILVGIKIAAYLIFFMYSLNRYRSLLLDVLGVLAANAAAIFAANYLFNVSITDNLVYFGIVAGFDLLISIMVRFLIRTSGENDDDEYDDDEDDENQNTLYQSGIFDPNYKPTEPNLLDADTASNEPEATVRQSQEPDPELIALQQEKDRKIDLLMAELQEKEQRIALLENKIAMQPDYPIYADTAAQIAQPSPTEEYSHSDEYNYANNRHSAPSARTYADEHKREILDKILDDIKTLYSTLNSRSRLVEEREYNLLLKMVELEERERNLDDIKRSNEKIFPTGRSRYRHREPFSPVESLPSDNPELAKNILKTIESLDAISGPPITLETPPKDEYKSIPRHRTGNTILTQSIRQSNNPTEQPIAAQPQRQTQQIQKSVSEKPSSVEIHPTESKPQTSEQVIRGEYQTNEIRPAVSQSTETPPRQEISLENLLKQQSKQRKQAETLSQKEAPVKPRPLSAAAPSPVANEQTLPPLPSEAAKPKPEQTPQKQSRNEIDFNTVNLDKVKLEAEELSQISSLIDDL
ncbi:MAG: hypothetical protein ACC608_01100 [Anaerofustis sp.]